MDNKLNRQTVIQDLIEILTDMTSDWDLDFDGSIGPNTALIADLGFESIDVVQFVVAIEERYQRRDLAFETFLMEDGRYVDEIIVEDTAEFLCNQLNN